jgi:hypothetical protein
MISGKLKGADFRRWLFRGLNIHTYFFGLDALDAITAALYFEGKLPLFEHTPIPDDVVERTTELRMNISAYYSRCARFQTTNDLMDYWCVSAIDEFQSFHLADVTKHGLTDFRPVFPMNGNNWVEWKKNFTMLSHRLMTTSNTGRLHAPLTMDLHVLQLLFLEQNRPVFFAPVYAMITQTPSKEAGSSYDVYVQVPPPFILFTVARNIPMDTHLEIMNKNFIVVPYMPFGDGHF